VPQGRCPPRDGPGIRDALLTPHPDTPRNPDCFGIISGGFLPTPAPGSGNWEPSLAEHHLGDMGHPVGPDPGDAAPHLA